MNEHTKELIEQAGFTFDDNGDINSLSAKRIKKLVELTVLKCAECINTPNVQAQPPYDQVFQTVRETLVDDMKAYFGVEE